MQQELSQSSHSLLTGDNFARLKSCLSKQGVHLHLEAVMSSMSASGELRALDVQRLILELQQWRLHTPGTSRSSCTSLTGFVVGKIRTVLGKRTQQT